MHERTPSPSPPGRQTAGPGATGPGSTSGTGHVPAIDVLRVLTVVGVIAVHSTSLLLPADDATGAVLTVLHTTREIFLVLSAAVLAHSAAGGPLDRRRFWRRRYPLVAIPYLVWSAVYLMADGHLSDPAGLPGRYLWDLLTGGARFHLYFLLLTFQLYLIFPWLYRFLRRRSDLHRAVVVAGVGFQLAFTSAIHFDLSVPFPLSVWLTHPGSWLPSYAGYVVVGVVVGLHLDEVLAWIGHHGRMVRRAALVTPVLSLIGYVLDVHLLGMGPLRAGEVFQPAVVVDSVAFFALFLSVGLAVVARSGGRAPAVVTTGSVSSFGVYLAHPLLIQGLVAASGAVGLSPVLGRLPPGVAVVLVVGVFAPALFALTTGLVVAARRTPLALALTGRHRAASSPAALDPGQARVAAVRPVGRPALVPALAVVAVVAALVALGSSTTGGTVPAPRHAAGRSPARGRRSDASGQRPATPGGVVPRSAPVVRRAVLEAARTQAPVDWITTDVSLTYDGLTRSYLVTAPPEKAGTRLPVLMVLHGRSVTPQFEEDRTDFEAVTGPAILVYPAGYGESWDAGLCCSVAAADHVDDVGFLTTVLRDVLRSRPDAMASRVYLTGYSNGGRMALTMACDEPHLFAAVAVYAATSSEPCATLPATSFLMVASTGDPELTLGPGGTPQTIGSYTQPTVTGQVEQFRSADRCAATSSSTTTPGLTRTAWRCADGRHVGLDLYQGGSHSWPTGSATTPSAEAVIWSWFAGLGA
jgi:poly(3-hydroxybutyrate) depolymerase/peptidoglycan/LPS O-acetylase OafA/YrhL